MKTAICYYSRHHGNTLKVLQAMADKSEVDLIDVTTRQTIEPEKYDCVGFASGIYGFDFQKSVVDYAKQYLPQGKPVFFVYTYGGAKAMAPRPLRKLRRKKAVPFSENSAARGMILSAPSNWLVEFLRATPTRRTCKTHDTSFNKYLTACTEVQAVSSLS